MRVIAISTLKIFWSKGRYEDSKEPLRTWYYHTLKANWTSPADVKLDFRTASVLQDGRVVFNISGNKYRLIVWINYAYQVVYIRFIGTHKSYDKVDAQSI